MIKKTIFYHKRIYGVTQKMNEPNKKSLEPNYLHDVNFCFIFGSIFSVPIKMSLFLDCLLAAAPDPRNMGDGAL